MALEGYEAVKEHERMRQWSVQLVTIHFAAGLVASEKPELCLSSRHVSGHGCGHVRDLEIVS